MRSLNLSCLILLFLLIAGCASLGGKKRVLLGVTAGGLAGAAGGAILSPNAQSREMNALVFGLSGALAGGVLAVLTEPPPAPEKRDLNLRERELGVSNGSREFQMAPVSDLPTFVKERLKPAIIEEYQETDRVSEDGELHEPHKVYRIKRPAELSPRAMPSTLPNGGAR